ncbi:hypothetical protein B9G54_04300 [Alloscardovia macacae]|uniref:Uncharacterized protein n=1 Tax=Alloscardovia macacae TaxID=1160091 RepID=A0A1Y2SU83_9BIFI|nr:hypothetical protein [Alloscardovia macacae]OTA26611.1 hypothetical protein B9G54_04300 [Alloscardovia macacae]OTA29003.1 hypothetical protein B9T39_04900 [Alloscardovia macacae]
MMRADGHETERIASNARNFAIVCVWVAFATTAFATTSFEMTRKPSETMLEKPSARMLQHAQGDPHAEKHVLPSRVSRSVRALRTRIAMRTVMTLVTRPARRTSLAKRQNA